MKQLTVMYFSPTGTSAQIAKAIAQGFGELAEMKANTIDLTRPENRRHGLNFDRTDRLVLGYPVYGGRVPKILQGLFQEMEGQKTPLILAAVYGNRAYEDALAEAHDIFSQRGFLPIAAGAFIGEHSYSKKVAGGRPDRSDLNAARELGKKAFQKLEAGDQSIAEVKGNRPYKEPMPGMPFAPKTSSSCTKCGICWSKCPMDIIDKDEPRITAAGCILCSACIKACPEKARSFDAEPILKIKAMLETKFLEPKEPELFL